MSNYIKTLESKVRSAERGVVEILDSILELRMYLESPKFHADTTVQVKDVFARLRPVTDAVLKLSHSIR